MGNSRSCCTGCANLRYTLCFVNSFRRSRAIAVLKTNSETRILGNFGDITNNEIGQQIAEIFELKEISMILTCILRGFSVHFENFGRLYLLKYRSHRLVQHTSGKLRRQRMCLYIQKVTSRGNPKFSKTHRCRFQNGVFRCGAFLHFVLVQLMPYRPNTSLKFLDIQDMR